MGNHRLGSPARRRTVSTSFVLFLGLAAGCGEGPWPGEGRQAEALTTRTGSDVSVWVAAEVGATLEHPAGVRLVIPAGGLSGNGTARIRDLGVPLPRPETHLLPASNRFAISIDGVASCHGVALELPYAVPATGAAAARSRSLALATQDLEGQLKLVPIALNGQGVAAVDLCTRLTVGQSVVHVVYIPDLGVTAKPSLLNVPYYWQDDLPWCVPSALAMVMNQFDGPEGVVANFALAGADGQAADEGNSYVDILNSLGVAPASYSYLKWDADLIPSAPFTNYVKLVLNNTLRGLGMSSTTTSHAFVAVGANDTTVWLHDSSGAFAGDSGIAIPLSWDAFKTIAIDTAGTTELRTLLFFDPLRPANERTGSIVLDEGTGGSLAYRVGGVTLSRWQWDGAGFANGYRWDDATGILPADATYQNRFPRDGTGFLPGSFTYKARVANVTASPRNYQLWVFLGSDLQPSLEVKIHNLALPAYSWKGVPNTVTDVLDDFVIYGDGEYHIHFELWEAGNYLDSKKVRFRVGN